MSIADIPAVLFAVVAAQHLQAPQPPPPRPPPPPPPSSLPSSPPSQTPAPPPRSPPPRLPSPSRRRRLLRCHRRRRPHHRLHCRLHCRLHRCEARSRTRCPRNSLWCKCVHARPSPVRGAAFLQVLVRIWRYRYLAPAWVSAQSEVFCVMLCVRLPGPGRRKSLAKVPNSTHNALESVSVSENTHTSCANPQSLI